MAVSDRDDDELPDLISGSDNDLSHRDTLLNLRQQPVVAAEAKAYPTFYRRAPASQRSSEQEVQLKITRFFNDMSFNEIHLRPVDGVTLFEYLLRDVYQNRCLAHDNHNRIKMNRHYYQRLRMLYGPEENQGAPNQVPVVDFVGHGISGGLPAQSSPSRGEAKGAKTQEVASAADVSRFGVYGQNVDFNY